MKIRLAVLFFPVALALGGCSTVDSRISGHQAQFNTWPPQVQQMVKAGQVAVGFTREQVQVALGSPDRTYTHTEVNGSFEVWSYASHAPHFSFGVGMASGGHNSATGVGVSTGTNPYPDERLRVTFDPYGRVSAIEQFHG